MSTAYPINRRSFLARTAKLGAAGVVASPVDFLLAADTVVASKPAWQLGCYTRVYDQFDYSVALDAIAEAGFKYVGLLTTNTKQWVMINTATPPEEVQSMKDAATKRGLKVLSVYGDFSVTESLEAGISGLKRLATSTCRSIAAPCSPTHSPPRPSQIISSPPDRIAGCNWSRLNPGTRTANWC
jgi:sugar phosphate isomerase/epimerase